MNAEEAKYQKFQEVWAAFEKIRIVLKEAGIPEDRLLTKEQVEKKLFEWHINKVQDTLCFINTFTDLYIRPWLKIRTENPEDYWIRAKLFKWGDEYTEIRELNKVSKLIRENWFDRRNILVRQKREKKTDA